MVEKKYGLSVNMQCRWMIPYMAELQYPIINAPKSKPDLFSAAQIKNSEGQKIYTHIVLTLTVDQKVFLQPSQYCNFLCQGGAIHRFYACY